MRNLKENMKRYSNAKQETTYSVIGHVEYVKMLRQPLDSFDCIWRFGLFWEINRVWICVQMHVDIALLRLETVNLFIWATKVTMTSLAVRATSVKNSDDMKTIAEIRISLLQLPNTKTFTAKPSDSGMSIAICW